MFRQPLDYAARPIHLALIVVSFIVLAAREDKA